MIETLLSSGANPLAKDFNENTILHEAVDAKRVLSVRIALKANVPINSANAVHCSICIEYITVY